jgi:hypothetical protein
MEDLGLLSYYLKSISRRCQSFLKVAHINAQSLNDSSHFIEFNNVFSDSSFDIVAVSETFYNKSSNVDIPRYNVFYVNRKGRNGGGVAVYVSDRLTAKVLTTSDGELCKPEYILLEVHCETTKILVAAVYRPPKVGFMDTVVNDIYKFLPNYKYAVLMGDLNARFGSGSFETSNVEECLSMCNFTSIPYEPTYHTLLCDSTLDVIASNLNDLVVEYGQTVAPGFSNHDLIYAVFDLKVCPPARNVVSYRDFKKTDLDALKNDAEAISWQPVYDSHNVDDKVKVFNSILMELMDKHAPIRTISIKNSSAPWFTAEVKHMICIRDKARRKHLRTKDINDYETFRLLRNKTKQAIKSAKAKYFHDIFRCNKSPKEMWSHINNLSKNKNKKCGAPSGISPNDLNQHYLKVSTVSSENDLHQAIIHYESYPSKDSDPFYFKYVTPSDIWKAFNSIKSKAQGVDQLSVTFLKMCLVHITCVLEHIFNFCLQSSVFPSVWKMANILPIPKVPNPMNCKDFRPVSILCLLSKVLEKLVHSQISEYLNTHNLLNPLQSGFRPGHSTKTALLKVTDDIRLAIDKRKLVLAVLLDFSKAFDKVHHGLLLVKLKKIGFSQSVVNWFYAYLSERYQRVMSGDEYVSEWDVSETGVPQGSVLGPLLFLLYINDISDVLSYCSYHLYADDLQIYLNFDFNTVEKAVFLVNLDLVNLLQYVAYHNLSLNVEKTQPIIYGSSKYLNRLREGHIPDIVIDGVGVPYKNEVNNLGITFDSSLSWTPQCIKMINNIFKTLSIVRRNFCYLPYNIRKKIVECMLFPIFDYSSVLLTDLSQTNQIKLQRAQNACVRFIVNIPKYAHITPAYTELHFLRLEQRRDLAISALMWNIFKSQSPMYLQSMFSNMSSSSVRTNRQSGETLIIPHHRTTRYGQSFCVTACRLWNKYKIYSFLVFCQPSTMRRFIVDKLTNL